MNSRGEFKDILKFTEKLAKKAGEILLEEQKRLKILAYKNKQDITTNADLASEAYIIKKIRSEFPEHTIISEERGEINKGSLFQWVIDPLDGTKEFVRLLPHYNVAISLFYRNEAVVGVVYRPSDGNLYSAAKNLGAYHNEQKVKVSRIKKLKDSFIYCYLPSYKRQKQGYDRAWEGLKELGKVALRLRSTPDANSALSWLSHGGCEAYLNLSNQLPLHDIGAGLIILKEAGGLVKDLKGKDIKDSIPDSFLAANSLSIYKETLACLGNFN